SRATSAGAGPGPPLGAGASSERWSRCRMVPSVLAIARRQPGLKAVLGHSRRSPPPGTGATGDCSYHGARAPRPANVSRGVDGGQCPFGAVPAVTGLDPLPVPARHTVARSNSRAVWARTPGASVGADPTVFVSAYQPRSSSGSDAHTSPRRGSNRPAPALTSTCSITP